jgi:hypothetical protein
MSISDDETLWNSRPEERRLWAENAPFLVEWRRLEPPWTSVRRTREKDKLLVAYS